MRTKFTLILCAVLLSTAGVAQENTVTLKTTGSAETKEKAVQYALRSAIEQAFGAFISSNTEILNDELVADEITSVASGNIEKYDVLSETVNEKGNSWFVTANVIVSVGKLTEFVQAKGVEVEVKGGLFVINIKQKQLNSDGEYKALLDMLKPFHEAMLNAYDYELEVGQPVAKDQENKNWEIDLLVESKANQNLITATKILENTLSSISLNSEELIEYNEMNKDVFPVLFDIIDIRYNREKQEQLRRQKLDQQNALQAKKEEEKRLALDDIKKQLNGSFPKGTSLTTISNELNIPVSEFSKLLGSSYQYYVKGESDKAKLKLPLGKQVFLDYLWTRKIAELDGTAQTKENIGLEKSEVQKIYFLRNRKSFELLKFLVASYLNQLYGRNFDITSEAHNYYSFPDIQVSLDNSLIAKQGHSFKINGEQSTLFASKSDILKKTERSYFRKAESLALLDIENLMNYYRVCLPKEKLLLLDDESFNKEIKRGKDYVSASKKADFNSQKWEESLVVLCFMPMKTLTFKDSLSLNEVEALNGYKVSLNKNVFSFSNGGITFKHGTKKIIIPVDPMLPKIADYNLLAAREKCKNFISGGFSDWVVPDAEDAYFIFRQYHPIIQYSYSYNGKNDFSYNMDEMYGLFIGLRILTKTPENEVFKKIQTGHSAPAYRNFTTVNYKGSFSNSAISYPEYCFCIREIK